MAPKLFQMFKNYFIDPWLYPDKTAFFKASLASAVLLLVSWSFMATEFDWKDYTVPTLMFG
jgi:hypothetical protein